MKSSKTNYIFLERLEPETPPSQRFSRMIQIDGMPVLEMRNPNEGSGSDPDQKSRYQYILADGVIYTRHLPPEHIGDKWHDTPEPPGWREWVGSPLRGPVHDYAGVVEEYDRLTVVTFDAAENVGEIRYRLAAIDVGYELREGGDAVRIAWAPRVRVSYSDRSGAHQVASGPIFQVLRRLEIVGYLAKVEGGPQVQ